MLYLLCVATSVTKDAHTALALISACKNGGLMPRGAAIVNANVQDLLRGGLIKFAPRADIGYALTTKGKKAL